MRGRQTDLPRHFDRIRDWYVIGVADERRLSDEVIRLFGVFQNLVPYRCSSDSDEEPVTKQPRLSRRHSRGSGRESPGQSARSTRSKRHRATRSRYYEDPATSRADLSDTDASSENRSISDGSYFEVRTQNVYICNYFLLAARIFSGIFAGREHTLYRRVVKPVWQRFPNCCRRTMEYEPSGGSLLD